MYLHSSNIKNSEDILHPPNFNFVRFISQQAVYGSILPRHNVVGAAFDSILPSAISAAGNGEACAFN